MDMEIDLRVLSKAELCDEFNLCIKEIMFYIECYNPDDFNIEHAAESLRKLINYNPLDLLKLAHNTLWEYREQIKNSNEAFFLKEDLVTKFNVKECNKDMPDIDIEYIINQIKTSWNMFAQDEQKDVVKHIKFLLKVVAVYRAYHIGAMG